MNSNQQTSALWRSLITQTKQATGFTPSEIRRNAGLPSKLSPPEKTAAELKAEEIIAINRLNSKGFSIVDINPNAISREEAFTPYDGVALKNLIGGENVFQKTAAPANFYDSTSATQTTGTVLPYWRTVFIPLAGNFLKVEYLQARVNPLYLTGAGTPAREFQPNFTEPQNNGELAQPEATYNTANKVSSERIILLDFNNVTPTPIIAKHGDNFTTYFSGVYVTFKQNSPRIRITVGYNARIDSEYQQPTSLSLWTGNGLLGNPTVNPVPFTICDKDVTLQPLLNYSGVNLAGSAEYCLVANAAVNTISAQGATGDPPGMGLFWITGFSVLAYTIDFAPAVADFNMAEFQLRIKNLGTAVSNYVTGSVVTRRISVANVNISSTVQGSVDSQKHDVTFVEPIRVCLRQNQGLFILCQRLSNGGLSSRGKFVIHGYSYGPMQYSSMAGEVGSAPMVCRYLVTENPYPIDLDDYRMPQL